MSHSSNIHGKGYRECQSLATVQIQSTYENRSRLTNNEFNSMEVEHLIP
jgi:hypothetical protein